MIAVRQRKLKLRKTAGLVKGVRIPMGYNEVGFEFLRRHGAWLLKGLS
jgi:hypothetical protein